LSFVQLANIQRGARIQYRPTLVRGGMIDYCRRHHLSPIETCHSFLDKSPEYSLVAHWIQRNIEKLNDDNIED
jgi:hypothetical protein